MLGVMLLLVAASGPASAATIQVTTSADENGTNASACSLREAIAAANTNAAVSGCPAGDVGGTDRITFAAGTNGNTILLTNGVIAITSDVEIVGNGAARTKVDGQKGTGSATQVFTVSAGITVTLDALTVQNGFTAGLGAGINNSGTLRVTNAVFTGNRASNGGGIANQVGSTLTVTDTTFDGNTTTSVGGGGIIVFGTATVRNSTFTNNTAPTNGGGVNVQPFATLYLINSTVSGNTAGILGGGLSNLGQMHIISSTLTGNNSNGGDGVASGTTDVTVRASIFANSANGANCDQPAGAFTDLGSNIIDDATCFAAGGTNQPVSNVNLGPLADNGGPTRTHALLPGSPALDAVQGACTEDGSGGGTAITTDQRGVLRPGGLRCDAGAYEANAGLLQIGSSTFTASESAGTAAITVTRTNGSEGPISVTLATSDGTATAPGDYTPTTVTVNFGDDDTTTKTVNVPIREDAIAEANETVNLALSGPAGGAFLGPQATATLTIQDNDASGTVVTQSGGSTAVTEGGATDTFTVVLTSQPTANVTITMNPGIQVALAPSNTLTFTAANWNTAQTVTVSAVDDTLIEDTHTGSISFSVASTDANFGGVPVSGTPISVTVTDNDLPKLSISASAERQEGDVGSSALTFTVTLAPVGVQTATVQFASADGTAKVDEDYTAAAGTLTFTPGETSKTIIVQVQGDTTFEEDETFRVTLSNPTNAAIQTAVGTGMIKNDDVPAAATGDDSGRGTGRNKDTDAEKPPSQLQQQQQDRTNDSNLDQYYTEGNVTAVERSEDGGSLLITIGLGRGETLVVEFRCAPVGCPDVRAGDYLSADGEQGGREEQGRFIAEGIEVTRNGSRVR